MLHRFLTASVLSIFAIAGCACASDAAKQETAPRPAAEASAAEASPELAASPAPMSSETADAAAAPATRSGNFVDGEHPTVGMVKLVQDGDRYYLEFTGDFKTDAGPDLFVILHRDADLIGSTEPPAHAIAEGSYANIAPLEATSGAQRYAIPAEVDPSEYQSVAIWCRQFNATFGAATLR